MEIDRLKLKKILLDKKVSQQDIASEIGISSAVVSTWFTKERLPDQYVIHLKRILGIESTEIIEKSIDLTKNDNKSSKKDNCAHYIQRIADLEANLRDKQVIIDLLMLQQEGARQRAKQE